MFIDAQCMTACIFHHWLFFCCISINTSLTKPSCFVVGRLGKAVQYLCYISVSTSYLLVWYKPKKCRKVLKVHKSTPRPARSIFRPEHHFFSSDQTQQADS
jgi:hypothetical protein